MRRLWVTADIDAPTALLWELLTDPQRWPAWGPSIRGARVDGGVLGPGATGHVTTVGGVDLRFEVTEWDEGARWAWTVAGLPATDHTVEPLGPDRCRVGFGVPWPAAPYLAVCRVALGRLRELAAGERAPR